MRRIALILLSAPLLMVGLVALPAHAAEQTHEQGGFTFVYDDANLGAGAVVTAYSGGATVVIPSTITDNELEVTVKAIGDEAFSLQAIASVTLPETLETIGFESFYGTHFTEIDFPDSLDSIGSGAFNASGLTSVDIPDTVTSIGTNAFRSGALTEVSIGSGVPEIQAQAFYDNAISSLRIDEGVETIGDLAFAKNELAAIDLPESLQTISEGAFDENRLQDVTIPSGVTSLGAYAFLRQRLDESGTLESATFEGGVPSDIQGGGETFPTFDTYNPSFQVWYPPSFDVSQVGPVGFESPEWMAYVAEPITAPPSLKIKRPGKVKERKKFTVKVQVRDGGHHVEGGKVKIVFKGLPGKPKKRVVEDGLVSVKFKAPSVSSTRKFKIRAKYLPGDGPYATAKTVRSIKVKNS